MNVPEFVKKELIDFTGLSPAVIEKYVGRTEYPHFKDEWNFWKPKSNEDIRWFYVTSRGYLFGNAIHTLAKGIYNDIPPNKTVLDFGGGSGNYSFELLEKGCKVFYFDINLLQQKFVSYVAAKHHFDITVLGHNNYMPVLPQKVDTIIALDVLEHIPNYDSYIEFFSKSLVPGGRLYLFAPFGTPDPTHLQDTKGLKDVLKTNHFEYSHDVLLHQGAKGLVYVLTK